MMSSPGPVRGAETPHVFIVHGESIFCAGAQKMLGYFLEGASDAGIDVTVGMTPNARLTAMIPKSTRVVALPTHQHFSLSGLLRQSLAVRREVRRHGAGILHGWTARDWEVTSAGGWLSRRPSIGLLHDHPDSPHISRGRKRLMSFCSRRGLSRVMCVSEAVARECSAVGYPPHRLLVVRNGIPHNTAPPPPHPAAGTPVRLGYLGVFSERKGLRVLFRILEELATLHPEGWELHLAGGTQEPVGERLVEELTRTYRDRPWWPRLHWVGWVSQPADFVQSVDLLIVPSSEFDPFPTVLLEAGSASRPVLAANVGGVAEIVVEGKTGWLFDPAHPSQGAAVLASLLATPERLTQAGMDAALRVRAEFSVERMARDYRDTYLNLMSRGTDARRR